MKHLKEEIKNQLIDKQLQNNANIAQMIKFIGDFGKYKERKKYVISDKEYQAEIEKIQHSIYNVYHCLNVALAVLNLHKKEPEYKTAIDEINDLINERIADMNNKAEQAKDNHPEIGKDERTVN